MARCAKVGTRTADLLALCEAEGVQVELSAHNAGSAPQGHGAAEGPVDVRGDRGLRARSGSDP